MNTQTISNSSDLNPVNEIEDLDTDDVSGNDPNESKVQETFWTKFPQILRWVGGISLTGSAATFLLGGWMDAEPLIRYYSFFALTSALSIAGVFCGLKLKEDKGARTFLSLGTAFIPVLFCQLGALIYAQFAGTTSQFSEYLQIFEFSPIGIPMLAGTLAVALVLLSFYAFSGFSAMARPEAKRLTLVYMLANATLLLPFRSDAIIASIGLALLAGLSVIDRKRFSKVSALRTWDGRAMRALLFVPFGLLLLRSVLLYNVSGILVSLFLISISALFFLGLPMSTERLGLQRFYQNFSLLPLFGAWYHLADQFDHLLYRYPFDSFVTVIILPFAGFVYLISRYTAGTGRGFRLIGSTLSATFLTLQMVHVPGAVTAILALLASIAIIILSCLKREKTPLTIGITGLAISVIYQLRYAVELYQSNLWLSLAGTGVAIILAASYLERNWQKLIGQGKDLRHSLSNWN